MMNAHKVSATEKQMIEDAEYSLSQMSKHRISIHDVVFDAEVIKGLTEYELKNIEIIVQ